MRYRLAGAAMVIALLLVSAYPAAAGGWATVRLDEAPGDVVAGQPWRFGFVVKQHDRTPTNDVTPVVTAIHMATGEKVSATAEQVGAIGHFEAEMTFPRSGDWKWQVAPEPFAPTSLETLSVLDPDEATTGAGAGAAAAESGPGLRVILTLDVQLDFVGEAEAQPAESAAVTITDSGFEPSLVEIAPGQAVVWTNRSSIAHGVMSDSLEFRDSGLLELEDEFRQTFKTPGTYRYWCGPHPNMVGTIVVTDGGNGLNR